MYGTIYADVHTDTRQEWFMPYTLRAHFSYILYAGLVPLHVTPTNILEYTDLMKYPKVIITAPKKLILVFS